MVNHGRPWQTMANYLLYPIIQFSPAKTQMPLLFQQPHHATTCDEQGNSDLQP